MPQRPIPLIRWLTNRIHNCGNVECFCAFDANRPSFGFPKGSCWVHYVEFETAPFWGDVVSWLHWAGNAEEPWRRLIKGSVVEALDEDSGELVDIKPTQDDPNDVEGLLIDFRYTDAVGNKSRRIVLCRRCWIARHDMYIQGFCTLREALRTFRVDQMTNVEEVRTKRKIVDPIEYFAEYADQEDEANYTSKRTGFGTSLDTAKSSETLMNVTSKELEYWTIQKQRSLRAREACMDGMRVLAYIALADDLVTDEEMNIEQSYIEARLAMCGFEHDALIVSQMMETLRLLTVPSRSFARALNIVGKDREHFELILNAASRMAETVPALARTEQKALQQILDLAQRADL
jgi:hypothetical protein